jgi:peptidoglycan-associated lipoprotein
MATLRLLLVAIFFAFGSFGLAPGLRVAAQDAGSDSETAAELFEDGMDALAARANESGRRLLGRLIVDYPRSPEAARAKRALAALDAGEIPLDDYIAEASEAERTAQYRHAFLVDVGDRVFFAENSATIGGRARSMIENQARWLKVHADVNIVVIGRADDGVSNDAAVTLSRQRAEVVRDRLVSAGLASERIEIKAAGDADRLALCGSALCQAQNRNAEIQIDAARHDARRRASQDSSGVISSAGTDPVAVPAGRWAR